MRASNKRKLKSAARAGVSGIGSIISAVFKIIGTVLLIGITTGALMACMFVIYVKTNLMNSSELNVTLEDFTVNQSTVIYYRDNATGNYVEYCTLEGEENRVWADFDSIPKDLQHAIVSIEDQRFYKHHGVDWYRTAGAFVNMFLSMRNDFGGSTITQQLIKNLTQDNENTVQRKLMEIFRALEFEKTYDKNDIIEWYLNIVYFGHRQYGISAAADFYFGKEVSELSLAEMCSIVGITNNPSIYSPYINPDKNKERQETILGKMLELEYISEDQYKAAKAEKLNFLPWNSSRTYGTPVYPYYVDAVIEDVIDCIETTRGVSSKIASSILFNGGYKIYCCVDMDIQNKVDSIYQNLDEIPSTTGSSQQLQSGIVIIDPYSGDIVALSGGVGEKTVSRGLNWATSNLARRPTGSSIKPIAVYAPAMDLGLITPDTTFEDEADIVLKGTSWFPKNDDHKNRGVVTIRQAVVSSLNTISAQVMDKLTPQVSYDFLTSKLGITGLEPSDCDYAPLATGQQTIGLTVREMASAYTIFPNSGIYTEGRTFSKILNSDDVVVYDNIPESHPAISDTTAYWINSILRDAVSYGTGSSAKLNNMTTCGKTGTTSSNRDRWFAGYTPYYVGVVWTGYKVPEKISVSGNPAAQLWKKVMTLIHEDLENKQFSKPANTYQSPVPGVGPAIPYYVRGMSVDAEGGISVLYEEEAGKRGLGRKVQVTAKEVDGFDLVGAAEISIVLSDDPEDNIAEFMYISNVPVVEPPEDPVDPEDPENTGDTQNPDQPGTTADPENPDNPDNPDDSDDPDEHSDPEPSSNQETPDDPPIDVGARTTDTEGGAANPPGNGETSTDETVTERPESGE